jgi:hypothetical protein
LLVVLGAHAARADAVVTSSDPTPPPATTGTPARCKIAVLDLHGRDLGPRDAALPALLTQALAAEVATTSSCLVVTQAELHTRVDVAAQRATCADTDACLTELAHTIAVDEVITGSLTHFADRFVVEAVRVTVADASAAKHAERTSTGPVLRVQDAARDVVRDIYGQSAVATHGLGSPAGLIGTGGLVLGVVGTTYGLVTCLANDNALGNPDVPGKQKVKDRDGAILGAVVAGAGLTALAVGAVLVVIALVE